MVILTKSSLVTLAFGAIVTIIIVMACAAIGDITVHVTNCLSSNLTLIVHCHSKDDDLKARGIPPGLETSWSFVPNFIFHVTLFWCNLAVQDKRLSFVAYQQGRDDEPDSIHVYWVVKDDGVHKLYNEIGTGFADFQPWMP
ncbi:Self-incompatibility protein S1 [Linum perenne]